MVTLTKTAVNSSERIWSFYLQLTCFHALRDIKEMKNKMLKLR